MKKKEMEVRIAMLEGALLDLMAYVVLQGTEDEIRLDTVNVWRDRLVNAGEWAKSTIVQKVVSNLDIRRG